MYKILFVCTANIFRSRYSEEVYNHLVEKINLPSKAFSAGLQVGDYRTRKIYKPALKQLALSNIKPKRKDASSIHVNKLILSEYKKIICLDKKEHKPMVKANKELQGFNIEYWDIVDEPEMSSNISLPKCYKKVEELVTRVSVEMMESSD